VNYRVHRLKTAEPWQRCPPGVLATRSLQHQSPARPRSDARRSQDLPILVVAKGYPAVPEPRPTKPPRNKIVRQPLRRP